LEQSGVEGAGRVDFEKAGEEGVLGVGKDGLEVGCLICEGSLGLVAEEKAFVTFGVYEKRYFAEVALFQFARRKVSNLDPIS